MVSERLAVPSLAPRSASSGYHTAGGLHGESVAEHRPLQLALRGRLIVASSGQQAAVLHQRARIIDGSTP